MLEHLAVRDFALIESADIDLPEGFLVFTGETGAGKSLIVGAIGFLLGAKADTAAIRTGASECSVSGIIDISRNSAAQRWLSERDIDDEDGRVCLRRGMKTSGRSYSYIQNQAASRSDLADFSALVADIHGQHEHQGLLDAKRHCGMLDGFAGLEEDAEVYRESYEAWRAKVLEYRKMLADIQRMAREKEMLEYAVKEISRARIRPDEEDTLLLEEKALSQYGKLSESLALVSSLMSRQAEQSLVAGSMKAAAELALAAGIDPRLSDLARRLDASAIEIEDISRCIDSHSESLRFDPDRLDAIQARLAELRRLKKKYGPGLPDVISRMEEDRKSLESLESWEERKTALESEIASMRKTTAGLAEALSSRRREASAGMGRLVNEILGRLGMASANFAVRIEKNLSESNKTILTPQGMDTVEFMIAPNPGEAEKPLAKIASGGELSRAALAIKAVMASKDAAGTLVFDEIDTGIGGEVAVSVGRYLREISRHRQVLCVTHLASIAAFANSHFNVEKTVSEGKTQTGMRLLGDKAREEEIARMLAGDREGKTSLAHAAELLRRSSAG